MLTKFLSIDSYSPEVRSFGTLPKYLVLYSGKLFDKTILYLEILDAVPRDLITLYLDIVDSIHK